MAEITSSKARKKVYCDVCSTFVSSESLLDVHNNGKKHQRLLKARLERQECAERSVYVRGFCKVTTLESDLHEYFSKFGNVSNVFVDKEKAKYAIVEFQCPTEAKAVLISKELPLFHGKHLIIKKRSVKEISTGKPQTTTPHDRAKMLPNVKVSHLLDKDITEKMKEAKTVDDQVQILVSATSLTEDDNKLRQLIVQYLTEMFIEVYPKCEVKLFGSSSTGLGLKGADLDLCLLVNPLSLENQDLEEGEGPSTQNDITDQLEFIVDLLRQFAAGFQNIMAVTSAKCPLVKFRHRDSGLSCDLSINNRLAIRNTELLKSYVELDDRIRPLVITLKNWGSVKRLTGSGGHQISNYSLVLMLLHFLQRTGPPVIPVLQRADEGKGHLLESNTAVPEKIIIDGWDCSFISNMKKNESANKESFGDLLKGWFHYYGHKFDYGNEVVAIRHWGSKRLLKHDIAEIIQDSGRENTFKITPLSVQDPFELSHNVTQGVSVDFLKKFIQACMDAYSILTGNPDRACTYRSSSSFPRILDECFLDLFTVPTSLSEKPKKSVYSFTIPHPSILPKHKEQEEGKTLADQLQRTFEFITDILVHDLELSCEDSSSEYTPEKLAVESSDGEKSRGYDCTDHNAAFHIGEDICPPSRKRVRKENEPTQMLDVKKMKICNESEKKSFAVLCKASHVTWQNRRRQRRWRTQGATDTTDSKLEDDRRGKDFRIASTDQGDFQRNGKTQNEQSPRVSSGQLNESVSFEQTSPNSVENKIDNTSGEGGSSVMEFLLKVEHAHNRTECDVTLYYVNGCFQHFSNFYAFLKKFLMTKIAEHK